MTASQSPVTTVRNHPRWKRMVANHAGELGRLQKGIEEENRDLTRRGLSVPPQVRTRQAQQRADIKRRHSRELADLREELTGVAAAPRALAQCEKVRACPYCQRARGSHCVVRGTVQAITAHPHKARERAVQRRWDGAVVPSR